MQGERKSKLVCNFSEPPPNLGLSKVKQTRAEHQTKSQISSLVYAECSQTYLKLVQAEPVIAAMVSGCHLSNRVTIVAITSIEGRKGPKGIAHQTLLSPLCPQVRSLSRGRKWDSRQSRCIIGVAVVNKVVIAMITNEEGVLSGIYE